MGQTPHLQLIAGEKGAPNEARLPLRELYEKYGGSVYGRCAYLLRDRTKAEDAMQDVFAKANLLLAQDRPPATDRAVLLKIAPLGVGPDATFRPDAFGDVDRDAIAAGVAAARDVGAVQPLADDPFLGRLAGLLPRLDPASRHGGGAANPVGPVDGFVEQLPAS